MPFAYDRIRKAEIQFRKDQAIPDDIQNLISSTCNHINKSIEFNQKEKAKSRVLFIRKSVYDYLHSHCNTNVVMGIGPEKKLKERTCAHDAIS